MSGPISVNRSDMVCFGAVGPLVLGAAADPPAGRAAGWTAADPDSFTG
ncbi:hypothetical protein [Streptomyces sp. NPDC057694]